MKQQTLQNSFSLTGKGLHTGMDITITFLPAPENHGYKIQRIDLPEQPVIEAVAHARQLANTGYGEKNAEFARQNMNTELIAQKTILCYQQIYNLTLHENPTDR